MIRTTPFILLLVVQYAQGSLRAMANKQRKLEGDTCPYEKTWNLITEANIINPSFDCDENQLGASLDTCFAKGEERFADLVRKLAGVEADDGAVQVTLGAAETKTSPDGWSRTYSSSGGGTCRLCSGGGKDGFILPDHGVDPAQDALSMLAPVQDLEAEHAAEQEKLKADEAALIATHQQEYAAFKGRWKEARDVLIKKWYDMTTEQRAERADLWAQLKDLTWEELKEKREQLDLAQDGERDTWKQERDELIQNYLEEYQAMYTRQQTQLGAADESFQLLLARQRAETKEMEASFAEDANTEGNSELAFLMSKLQDDEFFAVLGQYELLLEELCEDELAQLTCYQSWGKPFVSIDFSGTPVV